jgi:hypothetical protein
MDGSVKNIIHRIHNDLGNMHACNFIDDLQNVITEYMKTHSFSVGISDLMADSTTAQKIREVIHAKKMEVKKIMDEVHLGIFKNNTADSNMTEFENRVNDTLIEAMNEAGKTGRANLSSDNRFVTIVNSGSKGKVVNISQMISCLGQQNVEGKRIQYGFDSRTLPHYSKYDDCKVLPTHAQMVHSIYCGGKLLFVMKFRRMQVERVHELHAFYGVEGNFSAFTLPVSPLCCVADRNRDGYQKQFFRGWRAEQTAALDQWLGEQHAAFHGEGCIEVVVDKHTD